MSLKFEGVKNTLKFIPPNLNPLVLHFARCAGPFYLKQVLGLRIKKPRYIDRLVQEYQRFFNNESKLILVFRHVHVNDAQVLFYVINNAAQKNAKKNVKRSGAKLARRPHAHFLYGRGVPVWGGKGLEWFFSRLGAIPVHHRKLDRQGLDVVRSYMMNGPYPIALAPEGQVTYHNEVVHEIEPGFAQLSLWAQQDLKRKGCSQDVRILPIAQYYRYGRNAPKVLLRLMQELQAETGIRVFTANELPYPVQPVLKQLGAALFTKVEQFYQNYYGLSFDSDIQPGECTRRRVERLVDAILCLQERRLGIFNPPKGFTPRIYIVRLADWNRIFVYDETLDANRSSLDAALDDYIAAEAGMFALHLEVVDLLAYMHPEYSIETNDINRHIEFILNLLDAVNRLKGGTIGQRENIRSCEVDVSVGTPISLSEISQQQPDSSSRKIRETLVNSVKTQFMDMAEGKSTGHAVSLTDEK